MADEWDWLKKLPGAPVSRGVPDVIPSVSNGAPDPRAKARAPVAAVGDETDSSLEQGDVVASRWRIEKKIGEGAYGEVYRAFDTDSDETVALKTFRGRLLVVPRLREAFKREALTWVSLDWHPFILVATWVREYSGRLFVQTDYIAPDEDGRVTLWDWLRRGSGPIELVRMLEWAIQFCLGMEHASAHGLLCHRDIKPTNILIGREGRVRIADFGLALGIEKSWSGDAPEAARPGGEGPGRSVFAAAGPHVCGSPGYMAPEILDGVEADVLSDIYSFGVVLWQMATGTPLSPFAPASSGSPRGVDTLVRALREEVYREQKAERVPDAGPPLGPIVRRCLKFGRSHRYGDFTELRVDLERVLDGVGGTRVDVPDVPRTKDYWIRRGACFGALGRPDDAIACFDRVLAMDQRTVAAWNNKGHSLAALGRHEDAIACYDRAIEIRPRHATAWNNKGNSLASLGRREDAIACYDRAIEIDPRYVNAWYNKGIHLGDMCRYEEAVFCHDRALTIDPLHAGAWCNRGYGLAGLRRHKEAIVCYEKALEIDPLDAMAWNNWGWSLAALGQPEEAIVCCEKALEIDPRHLHALDSRGFCLAAVGRHEEAIESYDRALAIDPRRAIIWNHKALSEEHVGRIDAARLSYEKVIEHGDLSESTCIAAARERLRQLQRR